MLVVGEPVETGFPVGTAQLVGQIELLDAQHATAPAGQVKAGRRAHGADSDHDDIEVPCQGWSPKERPKISLPLSETDLEFSGTADAGGANPNSIGW